LAESPWGDRLARNALHQGWLKPLHALDMHRGRRTHVIQFFEFARRANSSPPQLDPLKTKFFFRVHVRSQDWLRLRPYFLLLLLGVALNIHFPILGALLMSGKAAVKRRRKASISSNDNLFQRRRDAERMTRQRQSQVCQAQQLSLPLAFLYLLQLSNLTLLQGSASNSIASNSGSAAPRSVVHISVASGLVLMTVLAFKLAVPVDSGICQWGAKQNAASS